VCGVIVGFVRLFWLKKDRTKKTSFLAGSLTLEVQKSLISDRTRLQKNKEGVFPSKIFNNC
jgi:hypothetical protein